MAATAEVHSTNSTGVPTFDQRGEPRSVPVGQAARSRGTRRDPPATARDCRAARSAPCRCRSRPHRPGCSDRPGASPWHGWVRRPRTGRGCSETSGSRRSPSPSIDRSEADPSRCRRVIGAKKMTLPAPSTACATERLFETVTLAASPATRAGEHVGNANGVAGDELRRADCGGATGRDRRGTAPPSSSRIEV